MQESDSIAIKLVGQATWDRLLKEWTTPKFNNQLFRPPRCKTGRLPHRLQLLRNAAWCSPYLRVYVSSKSLGASHDEAYFIYLQGRQDLAPAVCLAVGGLNLLVSRASKEGLCVVVCI